VAEGAVQVIARADIRRLRPGRAAIAAALLCGALLLPASAEARKVGNSGTSTAFTATILDGSTIKVGSQTFGLGGSSAPVSMTGTVNNTTGAINVPESGVSFPTLEVSGYDVHIRVADPVTGSINPLNGSLSLNLRVWIKIDGVPLGGDCRIASDSSPIVVNPLTTGTSGSVTGDPYDPGNGEVKVVNGTFSVPASSSCGPGGGIVDSTVGIPSPSGQNNAQFFVDFNPTLTKGVNASFTATPSSGTTPVNSTLNASGTAMLAGVKTCSPALPSTPSCGYRWDYDNNGSVDEVTNTPSVSHTYTPVATHTTRLTVFDNDGDSDTTTRTITVNPPPPDLTINKSHSGNLLATTNEPYTIAVSNVGLGATQGTTTVTDTLPTGLTFVSGTGSGWSCSAVGQAVTCTRASTIAAGSSAPNITLTATVAGNAATSLTNTASVSTIAGTSPEVVTNNNSDSDPGTVDKIDVGITKDDVGTFETGTIETYELDVSSNGNLATSGTTTVTDTLPSGLTYSGFTASGWNCSAAGQAVTCTRGSGFAAGTTETIQLHVVAGPVAVPSVNNSASVSTPNDANSANNTFGPISTPVTATVDLTIDKSASGAFRVGSSAAYTIAVQNRGARPTSGTTTVADTLPAGLTPTGASGSSWTCDVTGQDVTCTSDEVLDASESAPLITVEALVDETALPSVTNTASVATAGVGLNADANTANNSDDELTPITATDLKIDKTHAGGFPLGGQGTYTLIATNVGDAPTVGTTTVTDALPAELSFVNATGGGWSCGVSGQIVTCDRTASIGAGQAAPAITLVVDVADTDEEETINSASVATADDVNAANDSTTDPTPLTAADLEITKSHTSDFRVGTSRAYTLRVGNVGSQPTEGDTVVTDELPDGLTYVNATGSGWSCGAVDNDVTCTRTAAIASGATAPAITVQVQVGPDAYPGLTNVASVDNQEDRNDANDSASDPTTVIGADLALTKSHLGSLQVNDRASYLIRAENVGTADTTGEATVTDTLPDGLTYAGSPSPDWDCTASGQDVTCVHAGSIAPGAHSDLELRADVEESAADEVTNEASVSLADDPDDSNDSDDDVAAVGRIDLTIDKSHSADLTRGGAGSFTIDVSNQGSDATDGPTHVSDDLPAGLSYEGASGTGWSCSVSSGTVGCTHAGTIAGDASAAPITLDVNVAPDADPQVTNTAEVSTSDDADASNDSDSDQADVTTGLDASISIRPQVPAGGSFRVHRNGTYTVTVRNSGYGAIGSPVAAAVNLPNGLSFVSADGGDFSCADAAGLVTCTDADGMGAGERADIALEVSVAKQAAPGVTTQAAVSTAGDSDAGNDTAQAATDVTMIDVAIAMSHTGTFTPGAQSSFTVNVENFGSAGTINPTRVIDELPAGLTFNSGSGAGWSCASSGQIVSCTHAAALAPAEQAAPLTLTVTPTTAVANQQLVNEARAVAADDGEPLNNLTSDTVSIGPAPAVLGQTGKKCKKSKKKGKKKKCKKKKKK
jgi:large repetitive protein